MKTTYYVAASLDGYIAKEDGDVAWLEELDISMEDAGYHEFYATIDALVMGRKTYDMVVSFGPWPYGDKPTWVCSTHKVMPVEGCNLQLGNTPEAACQAAHEMEVNHLWIVGGGSLASSFLEKNLLTDISLILMPIILGGGIKLFADLPSPLQVLKTKQVDHDSGFSQLEYAIKS